AQTVDLVDDHDVDSVSLDVGEKALDAPAPVLKIIKRIAKKAAVADVSPNVLRHTAATNMARRGVPLWTIAKILGNSVAMVERVYAKSQPDDLREGVEKISAGVDRRFLRSKF